MNKKQLKSLSKKLKVLSDPTRLAIINELEKPKFVKDVNKVLKVENTLLAHHNARLRKAGYIEGVRMGKCVQYSRTASCPKLNVLMGCVK